jgi:hypothetical protein
LSLSHRVKNGRGGVRSWPSVQRFVSYGNEGRAFLPPLVRSAFPDHWEQLVAWLQRPTGTVRSSGSSLRWSGWRCVRSARGSCRRRSGSRLPICATRGGASVRSRTGCVWHLRRCRASCAATRLGVGVTVRSMPTGARPRVAPATVSDASRATANCGVGRGASGPTVEPPADQPSLAVEVP